MPQFIKNLWQSKISTILGTVAGVVIHLAAAFPGHDWLAGLAMIAGWFANEHGSSVPAPNK